MARREWMKSVAAVAGGVAAARRGPEFSAKVQANQVPTKASSVVSAHSVLAPDAGNIVEVASGKILAE